jgi:uncharacterized protein YodC (DUF2158 family)
MENQFEVGDLVRLKSGGPSMVVSGVLPGLEKEGGITCEWSDKRGKHSERFSSLVLEKVQKAPGPQP